MAEPTYGSPAVCAACSPLDKPRSEQREDPAYPPRSGTLLGISLEGTLRVSTRITGGFSAVPGVRVPENPESDLNPRSAAFPSPVEGDSRLAGTLQD